MCIGVKWNNHALNETATNGFLKHTYIYRISDKWKFKLTEKTRALAFLGEDKGFWRQTIPRYFFQAECSAYTLTCIHSMNYLALNSALTLQITVAIKKVHPFLSIQ